MRLSNCLNCAYHDDILREAIRRTENRRERGDSFTLRPIELAKAGRDTHRRTHDGIPVR